MHHPVRDDDPAVEILGEIPTLGQRRDQDPVLQLLGGMGEHVRDAVFDQRFPWLESSRQLREANHRLVIQVAGCIASIEFLE